MRLRRELRRLLGQVDRPALEALRRRCGADWPAAQHSKYWELERQLAKNLRRAHRLGLDRPPPGRAVLDLGAGFGYFACVCGFYGQRALALDFDDSDLGPPGSLYEAVTRVLGVERRLWTIRPFRPLPETGARYDLVTAFAALFNEPAGDRPWGAAEWRFFLADLAGRVLAPGGRVFLSLNRTRDGRYLDAEVEALFRDAGAEVDGRDAYFPRLRPLPAAMEA
jgi:hypothetical protein